MGTGRSVRRGIRVAVRPQRDPAEPRRSGLTMAQIDLLDGGEPDFPTYRPPRVSGANTGTSPYSAPSYQAPYQQPSGFAPGEPNPQTPQTPQMPQGGGTFNPAAIQQYLRTLPVSSASLQSAFPYLQSQGWLPAGSYLDNSPTPDEIFVPGQGWIDVLVGADGGNPSGWSWQTGGGGLGGYFSDPAMQQYMNFAQQAMQQLMGPQSMNPVLQDAIAKLQQVFS